MRKTMKKYLCLSLAFVLSACSAVGPNYLRPEVKVQQTFTENGGSATLRSNWWEDFHDPALNALVAGALDGSPDLMISQARLRQARAMQGIQDAASGPTVDFKSGVSRDRISKNSELLANLPIKNVTTEFTNYQVNFDASWEIDLFGHQKRLSEGARARAEASA